MNRKAFYFMTIIVLLLAIMGACITSPDDDSSSAAGASNTSVTSSTPSQSTSGTQSIPDDDSSKSGDISDDSSDTSSDTSSEDSSADEFDQSSDDPGVTIDPGKYGNVTDASLGADSIDSYFDNSVFVGNSIMLHYKNYVTTRRNSDSSFLGSAKFFASASFSCYNNMQPISGDSTHPSYQGEKMKIEDAVAAMGVDTVYFSGMALNEVGLFGAQKSAENLASVVDAIKAKSPNVKIVVLANTYMVRNFNNYQNLHNGSISEYNNLLLEYCNENGYDFVDISTSLVSDGCLADKFCTDNAEGGSGCHLTKDAYAIWTSVLRDYAKAKQNSTYSNPDSMPLYSRN